MSLIPTERSIRSAQTLHYARKRDDSQWRVTWLPGRDLTYPQAITAMQIAQTVTRMQRQGVNDAHPLWPVIGTWAEELGLSGQDAYTRVTDSTWGGRQEV